MFDSICPYHKTCEHYGPEKVTCNKEHDKTYCGTYRMLDYARMKRENK